jgi:hypothetical protein
VRDLAIRLETEGVTDIVAREDYGYAGTWAMADARFVRHARSESSPPALPRRAAWREYLVGISFALPLCFSAAAILGLGFSFWGGPLRGDVATAVGFGVVSSFVASGGFVQALSRRGQFFANTLQFRTCEASTWRWIRFGIVGQVASMAAALAFNAYFDWMPRPLASVAALFHLVLGLFWLSAGALYMLDKNIAVAACSLFGLAGVVLLRGSLGVDLLVAQVTGIMLASTAALLAVHRMLRRLSAADPSDVRLSPLGRELYQVWPYFTYGALYFAFLFSDRLLAWTAQARSFAEFRGEYEIALNVALLAFILQVGWIRPSVSAFYREVQLEQERHPLSAVGAFNRSLTVFYRRRLMVFAALAAGSTAAACVLAGLLAPPMRWTVAAAALSGFAFIVVSLWNVGLLFSLSRPHWVLRAIVPAYGVVLSLGYLLSRTRSPEDAAWGFSAGALTFAVLSTRYVRQAFAHLDYYYCAATE